MLIRQFLTYLSLELNRSPLTVEAYGRDIRQFAAWLSADSGNISDPADATLNDIRAWLASLSREGISSRSLRRKSQSLRSFFRFLLKRGIISSNPAKELILPKIPKTLPDFIRQDEIENILDEDEERISSASPQVIQEKNLRDSLVVEMLYSLGLRRAELISISDNDISASAGEIKITGKRSKQRVVPVPPQLMSHIARWQEMRDSMWPQLPSPRPLLVVNGERISPSQVYRIVREQLSATSARKKSPHALRHSFATAMLNEGAEINSVKEFLGHTSLATTQIYTHISFSEMKKAYESAHPRLRKP